MIKITATFLLLCSYTHALKISLPTVEAVTHLVYSKDIENTKNYSYDIDFNIPYNKVNIYIKLRENGVENFQERENLANNLLVHLRSLKKKHEIKKLSVQVYYEKD